MREKDILMALALELKVPYSNLIGKTLCKKHTTARNIAMWVIAHNTALSYSEIGMLFGNRHHSTIIKNISRLSDEAKAKAEDLLCIVQNKFGGA